MGAIFSSGQPGSACQRSSAMQNLNGDWKLFVDPNNASNTVRVTFGSGPKAKLVFQGNSLEVWGAQIEPNNGPSGGSSYTIDGDKATVTGFQDPSDINDVILRSWMGSYGNHTLTIENDGAALGIDFFKIGRPPDTSPDPASSSASTSTIATSSSPVSSSFPVGSPHGMYIRKNPNS
ncbi:uncharacterized protein BXZ73DRAFT_82867 [Epithele typhae]|uniref:uncharacterized protein n=1 Tax=Epithele typhae TaxID=378194 RepID=UPI002008BA3F|nr:uncharacterized protein BXZ73DRAFT_82867 [Epithele typhae]KAH9911314.1 hypothetical protein BXZ73DRAFT_82867 [Epithele typhae]